ncbi:OLC1v1027405C1 [Oldenlandia corymbosa var. corymbosa]|uniref:OLC1v1027405C1 n=1 Tax=Oldenlandia corymbosa var. corymbosa TaxID=529605 RepID=A0AAV1CBL9_OLDCO|nr:OLC1v1027405C1 [Oldenlandia corymbosa var. corymbosa]
MSELELSVIKNRSTGKSWLRMPLAKNTISARYLIAILFLTLVCIGAFLSTRLLDYYYVPQQNVVTVSGIHASDAELRTGGFPRNPLNQSSIQELEIGFPLNCSFGQETQVCLGNYYPVNFYKKDPDTSSTSAPPTTCPDYFRWIHDDLWPWRETGITEDMVRRAGATANFRLVILNGTAYLETYDRSFQTRDRFTLYGILQLLRRYPGQLPDLDLMFDCDDLPVVRKESHSAPGAPAPPPVFHYCRDDSTLDIVFPDWSFWGWPEINVKPWRTLSKDLQDANKRISWVNREPYAWWKGNPHMGQSRPDLMKCNVSDKEDWGARLYNQDWIEETKQGFNQSDLSNQCTHRYKIYIEGASWSVSEKYILACDSLTLLVTPRYFDFFTRSLMPLKHYWPIKDHDKCRSIMHAVDWGNSNKETAQFIGKAGSDFIRENLKMDYVYDYMFHLLSEYAKLLKYKPSVPPKAVELCSESMACPAPELEQKFMREALVTGPTSEKPCVMPPPYDAATLQSFLTGKQNAFKQVDEWEKHFWDNWNTTT